MRSSFDLRMVHASFELDDTFVATYLDKDDNSFAALLQ